MESLADVQRRVVPVCKRLIDKMVIPPRAGSRAEGVDEGMESSEPLGNVSSVDLHGDDHPDHNSP